MTKLTRKLSPWRIVLTTVFLLAVSSACSPGNNAPSVHAIQSSASQIIIGESVLLDCDASDEDGDSLEYAWSADGGSFAESHGPEVTWDAPLTPGTYDIQVQVKDGNGGVARDSLSLRVLPDRAPVIESLDADHDLLRGGETTRIHCEASDPEHGPLDYLWSAAAGDIAGEGASAVWTPPARSGLFRIGVTVTDQRGQSTTGHVAIEVKINHEPRIIRVALVPTIVSPSGTADIECEAEDPDGDSLTYRWSATAGTLSGTGQAVSWKAPDQVGAYSIAVTVTDTAGHASTAERIIRVATPTHDDSSGGSDEPDCGG
ncbi:MAG: PKD domain-containing protein [Chloroflexota bacterium]